MHIMHIIFFLIIIFFYIIGLGRSTELLSGPNKEVNLLTDWAASCPLKAPEEDLLNTN